MVSEWVNHGPDTERSEGGRTAKNRPAFAVRTYQVLSVDIVGQGIGGEAQGVAIEGKVEPHVGQPGEKAGVIGLDAARIDGAILGGAGQKALHGVGNERLGTGGGDGEALAAWFAFDLDSDG